MGTDEPNMASKSFSGLLVDPDDVSAGASSKSMSDALVLAFVPAASSAGIGFFAAA